MRNRRVYILLWQQSRIYLWNCVQYRWSCTLFKIGHPTIYRLYEFSGPLIVVLTSERHTGYHSGEARCCDIAAPTIVARPIWNRTVTFAVISLHNSDNITLQRSFIFIKVVLGRDIAYNPISKTWYKFTTKAMQSRASKTTSYFPHL